MRTTRLGHIKNEIRWRQVVWILVYTLTLLLAQALWVSRFSSKALRVDLLLPLMLGIAIEWPPILSFFWAFLWGFTADALSGKFWGFHVGSYLVAICLVNMGAEKFEIRSPVYQMFFVGFCALGQSIVLALFLLLEQPASLEILFSWENFTFRALLMTLLAPFIIHPLGRMRKGRS